MPSCPVLLIRYPTPALPAATRLIASGVIEYAPTAVPASRPADRGESRVRAATTARKIALGVSQRIDVRRSWLCS
jgi:hypothetical protein